MINLRSLLPFCFSSLLILANATEQEPNVIYTALDPATEVRLGKLQRANELKEYHLSTNQAYIDAVNRIGGRIADTLSYERPEFIDCWQFTVIDTHTVNCSCLGGGQVMVLEGFLERVAEANGGVLDDDMVAAVLGHEMAHNVRRHFFMGATVRGSMEWVLEHIADIEKDSDGRLTPEELNKLRELARARFTRVQEFEADLLGALYATRAGFNGFEGARRWMQLEAKDPSQKYSMSEYIPDFRGPTNELYAYDHPTWEERIAKLESYQETILNLAGEFNWGDYLLKTYNFEKAAECFEDLTKVFPNSFEAWNNLGVAYHWQYLQTAGQSEKFQPGLVDYFVQLRERVRGASPLNRAVRAYQQALQINPHAAGTQSNLAIALVETHDPENIENAEGILQKLSKKDPDNPVYLNDLAILTYWKTQGSSDTAVNQNAAEGLFAKSAALDYLPARYNLAVLHLETAGRENDGVAGLREYLKKDSFSPWAKLAIDLVKKQDPTFQDPIPPISPAAVNVLNIRLGSTPDDVIRAVGQPERRLEAVTSTQEQGLIFYYDKTLGINVVFSGGKVIMVNVFAPQLHSETALTPEVAGVEIGASVEDLENKIGQPAQVRPDPSSTEIDYYYSTTDSMVDFAVNSAHKKIDVIRLQRRPEA
jgi:predicted Zn-dependent protease